MIIETWYNSLVDAVGVDDDAALDRLPEDLARRTRVTAREAMMSDNTWPGPTEGKRRTQEGSSSLLRNCRAGPGGRKIESARVFSSH
jgi:hypothetical protein